MEPYTGWEITVRIDGSSLGWMPEETDRAASGERYQAMVEETVALAFPGATVTSRIGSFASAAEVNGPIGESLSVEREEEVSESVLALVDRVFTEGGWDVAKALTPDD